jgi:hypothetical protein
VTCNIVYKSDLNGKASGKTNADALTVDIFVVYNDNATNTGTDKRLKLTATIKDCACCGAFTTSGTWLSFMCYNLGADSTLTTPEQIRNASPSRTNGSNYQWGKNLAFPATGTVTGWTDALNTVVSGPGRNSDPNAWGVNGGKTAADPCPTGWRVPSLQQFRSILHGANSAVNPANTSANTWVWYTGPGTAGWAVGGNLFLPNASWRTQNPVELRGHYWTTTWGMHLEMYGNNAIDFNADYSYGAWVVRCVLE